VLNGPDKPLSLWQIMASRMIPFIDSLESNDVAGSPVSIGQLEHDMRCQGTSLASRMSRAEQGCSVLVFGKERKKKKKKGPFC
jgi:hypothetical protein